MLKLCNLCVNIITFMSSQIFRAQLVQMTEMTEVYRINLNVLYLSASLMFVMRNNNYLV